MINILCFDQRLEAQSQFGRGLADFGDVSYCSRISDALKNVNVRHYNIALLALYMGEEKETFNLLEKLKKNVPNTPLIIISDTEKTELVVKAIKSGAYEFLVKPFSAAKIKYVVDKALENISLKNEINCLRREQDVIYDFDRIIAYCPAMKKVIEGLKKFAKTDSTIFMNGETGTGKSMLSGTVHYNSHRRHKPFVIINCANIQETLLESELFGHEKGSFTGADKQRIGRFEQANGGSIFLDEIGEMSLTLQAKLLRVLEERSFERVGGNKTITTDVRLIAATNLNLEEKIAEGKFREDLYYRINVLPIYLPPLRERKECLVPLANSLLSKLSRSLRKTEVSFSPEVLVAIENYEWPGNIRQLANTIERALILEEGPTIKAENFLIPRAVEIKEERNVPPSPPKQVTILESEKAQIIKALEENLWIQKDAAAVLGISPRVINHKIKKFGISHPRWRKHK